MTHLYFSHAFLFTRRFAASIAVAGFVFLPGLAAAQSAPANPPAITSSDSSAPDAGAALAPVEVARALRAGGYVVYFRHTSTDMSQNDSGMKSYSDCTGQRMLNSKGRDEARAVGRRIAALKLPTDEVMASPMCRTMETARLMFGAVKPANVLREADSGDYPGLKKLLVAPVAPGSIRWLVGHGIPFRAIAGAPHLAEGEAAVMRPEGTRWRVVARILPSDWAGLKN